MIILDATTRSLEVDLTSAVATNQLPFVAGYQDISQSTFAMSAVSANTGASNSTTAVTLVAAPGATTSRVLKFLSIKNSDTAAVELWVQMNDNTTLREIWKGTLAVGDTLEYADGNGWNVLNSSGCIKASFANTFTATRVPFAGSDGILTTDSGFTFNTTGDILTCGAINVAGTTAPTSGWYLPSADLIRTPNSVTIDDNLVVSGVGPHAIGGATNASRVLTLTGSLSGADVGLDIATGLTLSPSVNGDAYGVVVRPTINEAASGTHTDFIALRVQPPTIGAAAAATTNASALKITANPSGATNNYALWNVGNTRLDSSLWVEASPTEGTAGEQLTSEGAATVMQWTAAACIQESKKNIVKIESPYKALETIVNTPIYAFKYKDKWEDGERRITTGDTDTDYVGPMAHEAPWAMHHGGRILNPVNALGYAVLGIQALASRIAALEAKI